jgi:NAD(P)-dependent dehydrogenase (short-subunit alcohol dehydrogenase family)
MQAAGGGSIVNLGSIAWLMADGSAPIYTACKAAVTGLTRAHAREFGSSKIRVNAVLPGWVMTPRQKALWVNAEAEAQIDRSQCLPGRLVEDDIAAMVLFLASDQARMCTAQDFIVDGGWV